MIFKKILKTCLKLGFIYGVLAIAFFAIIQLISHCTPFINTKVSFPLSLASGFDVNASRIAIFSGDFARVQLFDKSGKFLIGWFAPAPLNSEVKISSDAVYVITPNDAFLKYSFDGQLLEKGHMANMYKNLSLRKNMVRRGSEMFTLEPSLFGSRVVRLSEPRLIIIQDPLYKRALYLFNAAFFGFFCGFGFYIIDYFGRKKKSPSDIKRPKET